jgi:hypothetical protein
MPVTVEDFEQKFNIQLPPLFRARMQRGEILQSKNSDFYSLESIMNALDGLEMYGKRRGFLIGEWGTGDAYVLLLSDSSASQIEESIYWFHHEINEVFHFSDSLDTLLKDEQDYLDHN